MSQFISRILNEDDNVNDIINFVINSLFIQGPVSTTDMELLSYLKLYRPSQFEEIEKKIINYMGVFYKNVRPQTLQEAIFSQYRKYILETYNYSYTPVQAKIIEGISSNKCYSFSAPTSTGKSYVFLNFIKKSKKDLVIVVPSRALINEYYLKLNDLIEDRSVNILTFIDRINTKHSKRSVFVVTPERCRELFKFKDKYSIDTFLFDEAQLSNEDSKRGLFFDSIVRRSQKAYPNASFVFAHPFVKNPDSQIKKNHFDAGNSGYFQFKQKNVGQMFLCSDRNWKFYHFGIDKSMMGHQKSPCQFDPIRSTIINGGSVLFYVSKSKIYSRKFLNEFSEYIDLCKKIEDERAEKFIDQLKEYTGGDVVANENYYSQMIALLQRGIVIHHGSLPLQTRIIIEKFTQAGFCKLCFATSTLEQGINMPFDVVFLDRLEASKPLSVKNLIGRAGRSTQNKVFDFGYVIIKSPSGMSKFRSIMTQDEVLEETSSLEKLEDKEDDYNDFKEAILNDTYSDEYNLTEKDLEKLTRKSTRTVIESILASTFLKNEILPLDKLKSRQVYLNFRELYSIYLGRALMDAEANVLDTAVKIIFWKIHGKTFKNICWYRYSYVSKTNLRSRLTKQGNSQENIKAEFITPYNSIPNKELKVYSLFEKDTPAYNVDYDRIIYDTYDYIDKLIGFKLSDIFYASFMKFYEQTQDERAIKLSKLIKYGTDNERHIWMLRYGLSFEDIELLDSYIESINSAEIVFKKGFSNYTGEIPQSIERFIK